MQMLVVWTTRSRLNEWLKPDWMNKKFVFQGHFLTYHLLLGLSGALSHPYLLILFPLCWLILFWSRCSMQMPSKSQLHLMTLIWGAATTFEWLASFYHSSAPSQHKQGTYKAPLQPQRPTVNPRSRTCHRPQIIWWI